MNEDADDEFDVEEYLESIEDPVVRERRRNDPQFREMIMLYMSMSDEGRERAFRACQRLVALPAEMRKKMTEAQIQSYIQSDSGDLLN